MEREKIIRRNTKQDKDTLKKEGIPPSRLGKKHGEETKRKISKNHRRYNSEETRRKISLGSKG